MQACACVRVCVYELVIALTQDKTIWEMFELSEAMHFLHNEVIVDVMAYLLTSQRTSEHIFGYYHILSDVKTYFADSMNKQYSLREGK